MGIEREKGMERDKGMEGTCVWKGQGYVWTRA